MRIRKQTYSLDQYLKLMKDETIRSDQDCQRLSGQWNCNMVNELIYTVLTDNYIPPIILGEETVNGITKQWVIDGLQRSSSLSMFRYGNAKITKSIDEYIVAYQRKILDENGKPKRDGKGELLWESVECDIRNKTYDQLPEELQDRFNSYQIETAIHQNCDQTEISKLVRKYNNHIGMNSAQKSFTYLDAFAREIREIIQNRFFLDIYTCSRNDRKNGTLERLVGDMVLICNYPDQYRKEATQGFKWLNANGYISDFTEINGLLTRLMDSIDPTKELREMFNSKHTHILVAVFKKFLEMGHEAKEYGKFLEWFVNGGKETVIDGLVWDAIGVNRSSRDANIVRSKVNYLVALFGKYFMEARKAA